MAGKPRITKDAEEKIIQALGDAKDLMSEGLHPDEAIIKAAEIHDLPAGHIRLMVQAYNTAQTNRVRKDGEDVFSKAAEFDVADAETVIRRLFPLVEKSAGDAFEAVAVSAEYSSPPLWFSRLQSREKAAMATIPVVKAAAYDRDPDRLDKRAHSLLEEVRRTEAELSRQVSAERDKLAFEFQHLENYFRRPGCVPFDEVAENAAILWGKAAADVMDQVAQARHRFAKQAGFRPPTPVNEKKEPYSNVACCLRAIAAYHEKKAALVAYQEKARRPVLKLARQFSTPAASGKIDLDDPELGEKVAEGNFLGNMIGSAVGSSMGQGVMGQLGGKSDDSLRAKAYRDVTDPAHEQKIRSLQTQAALHDMMANDPVISGYQPEDVLRVYNELGQLAPRSSGNPMLMRALIRKHLAQGQLDPFDISQLTGIETNLKDRDEPHQLGDIGPVPGRKVN